VITNVDQEKIAVKRVAKSSNPTGGREIPDYSPRLDKVVGLIDVVRQLSLMEESG
jgi:hypothetical protein